MGTGIHFSSLAALAFIPLAAGVAAEERLEVKGTTVYQEVVQFSDLDLMRRTDQSILRQRVTRAADLVCQRAEGPLYDTDLVGPGHIDAGLNCAEIAYRDARPQIDTAIGQSSQGRGVALSAITMTIRARQEPGQECDPAGS